MAAKRFRRIVVGVDGSEQASNALQWAIDLAQPLKAEVAAVFGFQLPAHALDIYGIAPTPLLFDDDWCRELTHQFKEDWCAALKDSGSGTA